MRNDKIGDFMLAWPAFAMLKSAMPESVVTALVPEYTKPLAVLCPWIDHVMVDPGGNAFKKGVPELAAAARNLGIDTLITLFSTTRIGQMGKKANIPFRLAPATKIAQFYYNHRLTQRRSRSLKPEFEYNLDLIRHFLEIRGKTPVAPKAPFLQFPDNEQAELKMNFLAAMDIPEEKQLVFLHAGSGGSANNLSLEQYAGLAAGLASQDLTFVLTAGPGEFPIAKQLSGMLGKRGVDHRVYLSEEGLELFARHIGISDCFIAGSTGPLHIAGALDIPTAAFYPSKRSSTPLRWKTLNSEGRHIAFCPPEGKRTESDMGLIDVGRVAGEVAGFIKKFKV